MGGEMENEILIRRRNETGRLCIMGAEKKLKTSRYVKATLGRLRGAGGLEPTQTETKAPPVSRAPQVTVAACTVYRSSLFAGEDQGCDEKELGQAEGRRGNFIRAATMQEWAAMPKGKARG